MRVLDIGTKDTMQLLLLQNEQVIETLVTHAAQKTFTDGIGARSVIGCFQDRDALVAATRAKQGPNLASRSRMRYARPSSISSRLA